MNFGPGRRFSETWIAIATLAAVNFLAHGLFYAPVIYLDDWATFIRAAVIGQLDWLEPTMSRPLFNAPMLAEFLAFGINVPVFHLILWLLHIALAVLAFMIARQIGMFEPMPVSLAVALLFLVYPTEYAGMWLIMTPSYWARLLVLLALYCLLRAARGGHWAFYPAAWIALPVSFGLYEAQVGLVCAVALLLTVIAFRARDRRWPLQLVPIGLAAAFAVWKTLGERVIGAHEPYAATITFSPAALLGRLLVGYKVSLLWGWTASVKQLLPALSSTTLAMIALAASVLVACGLVKLWHVVRHRGAPIAPAWALSQRTSLLRRCGLFAALGLALLAAGYIPVVTVFLPNLAGVSSRVNYYAGVGSTLFFSSAFMGLAVLLAESRERVGPWYLAAATPFVVLGIAAHAAVQYQARAAWQEQKAIWRDTFAAASNLADGTTVVYVLPGNAANTGFENWRRTPLTASWEIAAALRILYDNPTLSGHVIFPDVQTEEESSLTPDGVRERFTGAVAPYSSAVFFVYDETAHRLQLLTELPAGWVTGASRPIALGTDRLLAGDPPDVSLRSLVTDP